MTEPAKSLRPLPQPPRGQFIIGKKPGEPGYEKETKLASLRLLNESRSYQPGFDQQTAIIHASIQLIQTQSTARDIETLKSAFDEAFAYCLAANPDFKEKNDINLTSLGTHIIALNSLIKNKKIPVDPVIVRIDNVCKLALNHQPISLPAKLKSTLSRTSSGNSSPSTSQIFRKQHDHPIPIDPTHYNEWLSSLRQHPPSDDLQEDTGELEGTLAYCLTSAHPLEQRITDLENLSMAIASQPNPHLQRINQICQRATELLKNPPAAPVAAAPEPIPEEHSEEPKASRWNLLKIAIITSLALGGIAVLFMGYKHRIQILQKGFQVISRIKINILNEN